MAGAHRARRTGTTSPARRGVVAAAAAAAVVVSLVGLGSGAALSETATATVVADTFVDRSAPNGVLGGRDRVRLLASSMIGLLAFDVSEPPGDGGAATLRVRPLATNAAGFTVHTVAGSWEEASVTWNTAPPLGAAVASSGAVTSGTWTAVDVTSAVTAAGRLSLGLSTTSTSVLPIASRELSAGAYAAQLVITGTTGSGTTSASSSSVPTSATPSTSAPASSVPASSSPPATTPPASTPPASTPPATSPPPTTVVERARAAGIWDGVPIRTHGSYPYDYDGDGLLDLLVNPHNEKGGPRLFRNNGDATFTQVLAGAFISRSPSGTIRNDRHGCAWADVNQDGRPDFYCSMGANSGTLTDKANELWIQQSGGTFLNKAADYGVTDPLGPGRAVAFLDVNHDPYPDLYVTNNSPREDGTPVPNRLFINQSGTSYRSAPEYGVDLALGGVPGNQSCAQPVDYDGDGWQDLFVCGHTGVRLFRNVSGVSFTDVTSSTRVTTGQWRHALLADLDGDRDLDIVGINGKGTQFRVQLWQAGSFAPPTQTRTLAAGRQVAAADVDRDADLDVFVVQSGTSPDLMVLNDGSARFVELPVPQDPNGHGQSVTAFDHDQNGSMDLVVLEGDDVDGPVRLLSFP